MEASMIHFFCGATDGTILHLSENLKHPWPITMRINGDPENDWQSPNVTFFMSQQQFITFKNSVISEYESLLRRKKERKK